MLKKVNTYLPLFTLLIAGLWLSGAFKSEIASEEISATDLLLNFIGFFIVLFSIGGIFFVFLRSDQQISREQKLLWRTIRAKGKTKFIRSYVLKVSLQILSGFFILAIFHYFSNQSLINDIKIYGIIVIVFIVTIPFLVAKMWDYLDQKYRVFHTETHDKK